MPTRAKPSSPSAKASRPEPRKAAKHTAPGRHKTAAAKPPAKRKAAPTRAAAKVADGSKQSQMIAMLRSEPGATIDQMVKLTGWQPHTVRGTISGALRKRLGLNVTVGASGEGRTRIYRIVGAASTA